GPRAGEREVGRANRRGTVDKDAAPLATATVAAGRAGAALGLVPPEYGVGEVGCHPKGGVHAGALAVAAAAAAGAANPLVAAGPADGLVVEQPAVADVDRAEDRADAAALAE